MAISLPVSGHGKAVQAQGMYDAEVDAEDVWITTDTGQVVHCWYRAAKGWNGEIIYTP